MIVKTGNLLNHRFMRRIFRMFRTCGKKLTWFQQTDGVLLEPLQLTSTLSILLLISCRIVACLPVYLVQWKKCKSSAKKYRNCIHPTIFTGNEDTTLLNVGYASWASFYDWRCEHHIYLYHPHLRQKYAVSNVKQHLVVKRLMEPHVKS